MASASLRPGPQVGVEHAVAGARPGHGTRRGPVGVDLERGGDRGQLVRPERPVGKRQQAQDPAALRASGSPRRAMTSSSNEPRQRGARQLAAGGQQLLGDERKAAGSFGDEEEQAGRRPFALDRPRSGRPARRDRAAAASGDPAHAARPRSTRGRRSTGRRGRRRRADASPMIASRCSRAIRARNVISARVAASARCRSSMTSTTGCCSPIRPSSPRIALEGPCLATFRGGRPAAVDRDADRRRAAARDRAAAG